MLCNLYKLNYNLLFNLLDIGVICHNTHKNGFKLFNRNTFNTKSYFCSFYFESNDLIEKVCKLQCYWWLLFFDFLLDFVYFHSFSDKINFWNVTFVCSIELQDVGIACFDALHGIDDKSDDFIYINAFFK